MKRIVIGRDQSDKSVVLTEGEPPRVTEFTNLPGLRFYEIWATDAPPHVPLAGHDPTGTMRDFIAPPGGTRFRINVFPPDALLGALAAQGQIDLAQAGAEYAAAMPDLAAASEPENVGMHTTHTLDYNVVLAGEIWCELDDGVEVHLMPGDCLVQGATRHAWHNKGAEPCVMAAVMVGTV